MVCVSKGESVHCAMCQTLPVAGCRGTSLLALTWHVSICYRRFSGSSCWQPQCLQSWSRACVCTLVCQCTDEVLSEAHTICKSWRSACIAKVLFFVQPVLVLESAEAVAEVMQLKTMPIAGTDTDACVTCTFQAASFAWCMHMEQSTE